MKGFAIALGMFDSVHIGHRAVIDAAVKSGYRSVVLTFDKIPSKGEKTVLNESEKQQKLLSVGADDVRVLEFEAVKDYSPQEFLDYLTSNIETKKICCGFNFRFGKGAEGDTKLLRYYCEENGIEYYEAPEIKSDEVTVSTTYIKKLLSKGKVEKAAELLGERFSFTAEVVKGDSRGRLLGFPTANQIYPKDKIEVKFGVYHTKVEVDGQIFDGVTNVGVRPTFKNDFISAETYIIDYDGDCYGKQLRLSFVEYIRGERKFENAEELAKEICKNVQYVRKKQAFYPW